MRTTLMRKRRLEEEENKEEESSDDLIVQKGNVVYFHAPVTKKNILKLITMLHDAENHAFTNSNAQILLFIHSEGGDAHAGLSAMNHIQKMRIPVTTVADGFVASAGTFLLLAGKRRLGMTESMVLIHQVSTAFWGKYCELVDEVENCNQIMAIIRDLYQKFTTLKLKKLNKLLQGELTLSSSKCLKYGIFDDFY